jgi:hypothetical protein
MIQIDCTHHNKTQEEIHKKQGTNCPIHQSLNNTTSSLNQLAAAAAPQLNYSSVLHSFQLLALSLSLSPRHEPDGHRNASRHQPAFAGTRMKNCKRKGCEGRGRG